MQIGYIRRVKNSSKRTSFEFISTPYTRKISPRSDKVYTKLFFPFEYSEVEINTNLLKGNNEIMLVNEPFFLDEDLEKRAVRWVEWANQANPEEYDDLLY